jgi:hypothetical protein
MPVKTASTTIKPVKWEVVSIPIHGIGQGLLMSHIPDWVLENILAKQTGQAIPHQGKRSIEEQFEDSIYWLSPEREGTTYGFPAQAFKKSILRSVMSGMIDPALKGTVVRTWFTTNGGEEDGYTPILGEPIISKMAARSKDVIVVAVRALFKEWSTKVNFRYNPDSVSVDLLTHMLNQAGEGVGIGAFRPEKDGPYGRFQVTTTSR